MEIDLEIHLPGLDMNQSRWTHHLLFMQDVHASLDKIARYARTGYEEKGRGTLHVNRQQWREIVRQTIDGESDDFPSEFLPVERAGELFSEPALRSAFVRLLEEYDPKIQFVLTVEHPPGGALSCYLIRTAKIVTGGWAPASTG